MSATEKDIRLLEKIQQYCEKINSTVDRFGKSLPAFVNDQDYIDSVSMNILQIGELAGKLSDTYVQETKDEINWRAIKGMRNLFAHAYGSMDIEMIWDTVIDDIPRLEQFCKQQLRVNIDVEQESAVDNNHSMGMNL